MRPRPCGRKGREGGGNSGGSGRRRLNGGCGCSGPAQGKAGLSEQAGPARKAGGVCAVAVCGGDWEDGGRAFLRRGRGQTFSQTFTFSSSSVVNRSSDQGREHQLEGSDDTTSMDLSEIPRSVSSGKNADIQLIAHLDEGMISSIALRGVCPCCQSFGTTTVGWEHRTRFLACCHSVPLTLHSLIWIND